jgi:hypothetical protein
MANDRSISAKTLSVKVDKAVKKALKKQGIRATGLGSMGAMTIPPEWIGFILRDSILKNQSLGDVQKLATQVAGELGGRSPATLIQRGRILVGFVPVPDITIYKA